MAFLREEILHNQYLLLESIPGQAERLLSSYASEVLAFKSLKKVSHPFAFVSCGSITVRYIKGHPIIWAYKKTI